MCSSHLSSLILSHSGHQTFCFSDNAVTVVLSGPFAFSDLASCGRVAYLGVELQQGDSDQVKDLDPSVTDNNVRFAPLHVACPEGF